MIERRSLILAAASAASALLAERASAQNSIPPGSVPQRDWNNPNPPETYPDPFIQVLDKRFEKYMAGTAVLRRIWTGADWTEGPVWFGDMQLLIFSDIPNNRMLRYDNITKQTTLFRQPSNYANGNTRDRQGRLVTCEHRTRRVVRTEYGGNITVIAERYQGKRLNSPNGVVVKSDGSIWFTDPTYGIMGDHEGLRQESELRPAVYRVDPQSGQIRVVADDFDEPNGLCFSPDEKKFYVTDTGSRSMIRVFDVTDDGRLVNGKVFHDFSDAEGGISDDIRVDEDGNVWSAGGWSKNPLFNGVLVLEPHEGAPIGRIVLPETASNLCFGGHGYEHNRLYITAGTSIYAVDTNARGVEL